MVIRLADYADCMAPPRDVVATASATVVLCGLPIARMLDRMVHGGLIIEGSPHLEIGGPSFSLPDNMRINGPAEFQSDVMRDLYFLSTTETGKTLIDGLGEAGYPVNIEPCSDPHNSFAIPDNSTDVANGTGAGTVIQYNPSVAVRVQDRSGNWISEPPQVFFAHELSHAYHNAQGTNATNGVDPNGPASHQNIPLEESHAIGTGSHTNSDPSENSLRRELGLPERDNWWGDVNDAQGNELTGPTADLRPGNC